MKKGLERLWDRITTMFRLLDNRCPQGYIDRWNFITDIVTNEIRPEAESEARALYDDLRELYQSHTEK